jgi:plastocyanin
VSKKSKKKQQSGSSIKPATMGWIAAAAVVAIGVGAFAYMVVSSDSDSELGTVVTQTPDSRLAGETPNATLAIEAGDAGQATGTYFAPDDPTARAGDVVELTLTNAGSVAHNIRISGEDKQYNTADDWVSEVINAGDETSLVFKIDAPGAYPFQCDLHPTTQTGVLTLE